MRHHGSEFFHVSFDGFLKSPSAALRFIFRHCSVLLCTLHSSRFARLASGAFYCAVHFDDLLRRCLFWTPPFRALLLPGGHEEDKRNSAHESKTESDEGDVKTADTAGT
jgi:hypothetical protein